MSITADQEKSVLTAVPTQLYVGGEFRDATGHPLDPDAGGPKVTRDNDVFGREEEK